MPNLTPEIGVIFDREETLTYPVKEGDITVKLGIDVINGESRLFANFENEVNQNNFLEFVDKGDEGLVAVQLATNGGLATHFCQFEPELTEALPHEDTPEGDYSHRIVGVSQLGYKNDIRLPLIDANDKIRAGDKLEVDDPKKGLNKSSFTEFTCTALESKESNTGGTILVELSGPIRVKT